MDDTDFQNQEFLQAVAHKYSVEERLAIIERQHLIFAGDLQQIKINSATVLEIIEGSRVVFSVFRFLSKSIRFLGSIAIALMAIWGLLAAWKNGITLPMRGP